MKRIFSLLTVVLVLAIEVQAQSTVTVETGKTYRIAPASSSKKSLFVQNSSQTVQAGVVLWTETNAPAQQWTAEVGSDGTIAFKNVLSSLYLNYASDRLVQNRSKAWWKLEATGDDTSSCLLKLDDSYLRVATLTDGSEPTMGEAYSWKVVEVEPHPELDDYVRQYMADGFLQQYLQDKGSGYRTFLNGGWGECETMEAILDMYEATGERRYLSIYEACYNYFKYHVGGYWNGGPVVGGYDWWGYDYNDDVMWQIIGAARAYLLTGNTVYLNDAKLNFDIIWERAYLGYVGLLRWAQQDGDRNGANSCVNGPAEVAACYIALGTGDESYFEKARELYQNQRQYLANMTTGDVYDAVVFDPATVEVKDRNTWVSTYNQGTMLGAALLLYQHYGDQQYKSDADKIIARSRSSLCDSQGIINVCQDASGMYQGFKGILMRYAGMYVRMFGTTRYANWLKSNAMRAYSNLNSKGFGHSAWLTKSAENLYFGENLYSTQAFGGSTALSAAFSFPLGTQAVVAAAESNPSLFTINAAQAGHYRLNVYYKAAKSYNMRIAINDGTPQQRVYTPTGDYVGLRVYFVVLCQGDNTLTFTSNSSGLPAIEKVEAVYLAPVGNSLEAEHATTSGRASIIKDNYASGGKYVGTLGSGSDNFITFHYDADENTDYQLDITYFATDARQMYVRLNNGNKTVYQCQKTGASAKNALTLNLTVSLLAGTNTITLGNDSGLAPNIDKIEVQKIADLSGIDVVSDRRPATDAAVYNLRGMKMASPAQGKGIYIIGNKKVYRK